MKRTPIAAVVAFALATAGTPAVASARSWQPAEEAGTASEGASPEANALVEQAVERFQAKDYDGAVALFQQAYELSPEPNYLFNIGRVYEEKGDIEGAISYYEQFVQQPGVEIESRELAAERLKVLHEVQAQLNPEPEPQPVVEPDPVPDLEPEPKTEPVDDKPPKMRVAGFALIGVGAAVLATGTGFAIGAVQRQNELDNLLGVDARNDVIDRGERNALIADIMFGVGGAFALTGIILTAVSYRKKRGRAPQRASVIPSAGPQGSSLNVRVRF